MGVCKCEKRNVTNQFCYICRMNVCESCIVKNHGRCVIKSYVHWLQDSDYSSNCQLCMQDISKGDVLRLTCYDLFHWNCLNDWALSLPENTASSGYQCPDCKTCIFPPNALVSSVADVVREKLATVGWGRRGLGIPAQVKNIPAQSVVNLVTPSKLETRNPSSSTPKTSYKQPASTIMTPYTPQTPYSVQSTPQTNANEQLMQQADVSEQPSLYEQPADEDTTPVPVPHTENTTPQPYHHTYKPTKEVNTSAVSPTTTNGPTYVREKYQTEAPPELRKVYDTTAGEQAIDVTFDHDEDKYQRKGFRQWIGNVVSINKKSSKVENKKGAPRSYKRLLVILFLFTIAFMTMVLIMSKVGQIFAGNDPMLDPNFNPNIKVQNDYDSVI